MLDRGPKFFNGGAKRRVQPDKAPGAPNTAAAMGHSNVTENTARPLKAKTAATLLIGRDP